MNKNYSLHENPGGNTSPPHNFTEGRGGDGLPSPKTALTIEKLLALTLQKTMRITSKTKQKKTLKSSKMFKCLVLHKCTCSSEEELNQNVCDTLKSTRY